jgi:hypothetical protein
MTVDTGNAFIVGAASACIGFGLAYFAFKKFISKNFSKGKVRENRVYYWFGFIAMFAVGQGIGAMVGEVLYASTNNANINRDTIARGIITLIFYPTLLAVVAYVISKLMGERHSHPGGGRVIEANSEIMPEAPHKKSVSALLLILVFSALFIFLAAQYPNIFTFRSKDDANFDLTGCISCYGFKCDRTDSFKGIKVTKSQVHLFFKDKNGTDRIMSYPADDVMKCTIIPTNNFAFDCTSNEITGTSFSSTVLTFNGERDFYFKSSFSLYRDNSAPIETTLKCNIK